jgi:hypothetical protein
MRIRYICKSEEEIMFLWNSLKLYKYSRFDLNHYTIYFKNYNKTVFFIDEFSLKFCNGVCGYCVGCTYDSSINVNNLMRKEKLKRILE